MNRGSPEICRELSAVLNCVVVPRIESGFIWAVMRSRLHLLPLSAGIR